MKTYNVNLNIDEHNLDNIFLKCPFCLTSNKQTKIGVLQDEPLINALQCSNCHLGYADRQPSQQFLNDYYTNYFDSSRHTTIKKELLIDHLMDLFGAIECGENFNILDFGGGDGSIGYGIAVKILQIYKNTKVNFYVVDPNSGGLNNTEKSINVHNYSNLESLDLVEKMDIVIASASLEHVKDPRKVLTRLLHQMKPNGKFYARTPYIFPFKYLIDKIGKRLDIGYPGHLFDMGNSFWNRVLETVEENNNYETLISKTSLVETTFKEWFSRTLIAYIFKFPSRFFKKHYHFVGGWEIVISKK